MFNEGYIRTFNITEAYFELIGSMVMNGSIKPPVWAYPSSDRRFLKPHDAGDWDLAFLNFQG